jgi:hypothetical protein
LKDFLERGRENTRACFPGKMAGCDHLKKVHQIFPFPFTRRWQPDKFLINVYYQVVFPNVKKQHTFHQGVVPVPTDTLAESGEVTLIVTHVKPELRDRVKAAARENDRSVAAEVRHLLAKTYKTSKAEK